MIHHLFPVPLIFHFYQSTCGFKKRQLFGVWFCPVLRLLLCFCLLFEDLLQKNGAKIAEEYHIPQGSKHCLSNVGAFQIPMILMSDKNISNLPWRDPSSERAFCSAASRAASAISFAISSRRDPETLTNSLETPLQLVVASPHMGI